MIAWTVACQASLSIGFSRQEYWTGLPFPSPFLLLTWGSNPHVLHWQANSLPQSYQGSQNHWGGTRIQTREPNTVLSLYSRMIEAFGLWLIQWYGFQKVGCCRLPTESYRQKLKVPVPRKSSTKSHRTTPNLVTFFSPLCHYFIIAFSSLRLASVWCHTEKLYFQWTCLSNPSPLKKE